MNSNGYESIDYDDSHVLASSTANGIPISQVRLEIV
jgi:hypothetical protein